MKKCIKCKQIKDYSDFHKNKSQNDGYQKICKSCRKENYKNAYKKNKKIFLEKNEITW